jgi:hypothetical protein
MDGASRILGLSQQELAGTLPERLQFTAFAFGPAWLQALMAPGAIEFFSQWRFHNIRYQLTFAIQFEARPTV